MLDQGVYDLGGSRNTSEAIAGGLDSVLISNTAYSYLAESRIADRAPHGSNYY
jgi:hypothetical protein